MAAIELTPARWPPGRRSRRSAASSDGVVTHLILTEFKTETLKQLQGGFKNKQPHD